MKVEALGYTYPEMMMCFNLPVLVLQLVCFQHSVDFIDRKRRLVLDRLLDFGPSWPRFARTHDIAPARGDGAQFNQAEFHGMLHILHRKRLAAGMTMRKQAVIGTNEFVPGKAYIAWCANFMQVERSVSAEERAILIDFVTNSVLESYCS